MDFNYLRQQGIFGNGIQKDPYEGIFGQGMNPPMNPPELDSSGINVAPLRQANFGARSFSPQEITSEPDPMGDYTPEHTAIDRYGQLLGQYPQQDHPGILRRIAAVAAGLGGPEMRANQEEILHGKRNRAIEDWKTQIGAAGQAANLERYTNANERQTAYNIGQLRASNKRTDEANRHNLELEEAARLRNEAYQFRTLHPNHKIEQGGDGYVYAIDPQTNEVTKLGKWSMSDADKLNLGLQNDLTKIRETSEQARKTKGTPSADKPLMPSQDQILTNEAYANWIATGQPESDKINYNPDSKTYDTSGVTNKQALAEYIKNYRANFIAKRGGTGGSSQVKARFRQLANGDYEKSTDNGGTWAPSSAQEYRSMNPKVTGGKK